MASKKETCPECGKDYVDLKKHMKSQHPEPAEPKVAEPTVGELVKKVDELDRTIRGLRQEMEGVIAQKDGATRKWINERLEAEARKAHESTSESITEALEDKSVIRNPEGAIEVVPKGAVTIKKGNFNSPASEWSIREGEVKKLPSPITPDIKLMLEREVLTFVERHIVVIDDEPDSE